MARRPDSEDERREDRMWIGVLVVVAALVLLFVLAVLTGGAD